MLSEIKVNGTALIPVKDAAKLVSYTRDYVARLAREGKIVASQIGRQWFVDLQSLQTFVQGADLVEEVRKRELSARRKRELLAIADLEAMTTAIDFSGQRLRQSALVSTFSVLLIGLMSGVTFYTVWLLEFNTLNYPSLTQTVASVGDAVPLLVFTGEDDGVGGDTVTKPLPTATTPGETLLLTTIMEQPVFTLETDTTRLTTIEGGIVLLPSPTAMNSDSGKDKTPEAVAEFFSDPVTIVWEEQATSSVGTILFTRRSGETAEFPFVQVPTQTQIQQSGEVPGSRVGVTSLIN